MVDGTISYYTFTTSSDSTGPVISGVTDAVVSDTSAVITWTTDEDATSQVVYGTTKAYGSETDEDSTLTPKHSVTITGLTKVNTYFYKVISKDAQDNSTEDDNSGDSYSFSTTNEPGSGSSGGGGGILVITQQPTGGGGVSTDTTPPKISAIEVKDISHTEAIIIWQTNESADTFVEYGLIEEYEKGTFGKHETKKLHSLTLSSLSPATVYNFRVLGKDKKGNLGQSKNQIFTTLAITTNEELKAAIPTEEKDMVERAIDILKSLSSPYSMASLSQALEASARIVISPPFIAGEYPQVEVDATKAKFIWQTDKKSNSVVYLSSDQDYNESKDNPYLSEFGNYKEMVTTHEIETFGLEPSTLYHYKVESKPLIGPIAESKDRTFETVSLLPEISDINFDEVGEYKISVSWRTNVPCSSLVEYVNNDSGEKEEIRDSQFLRDHTVVISDLEPDINYSLKIFGEDESGNKASSPVLSFLTGVDVYPPDIIQVRTDSAISPRGGKVQVIISWTTNELSTSQVFFQEGVNYDPNFTKSTIKDKTLTKKHVVVISTLKQGMVYLFSVQSEDSSNNIADSKNYVLLTPQQTKTVVQVIIENFEQTFGWINNFGF